MNRTAEGVLWQLAGNEGAYSVGEIAGEMSVPDATVRNAIKAHVQEGLVEPLGMSSRNARCYGLTRKGKQWLRNNS
jgi:predicted transcriptional regulator